MQKNTHLFSIFKKIFIECIYNTLPQASYSSRSPDCSLNKRWFLKIPAVKINVSLQPISKNEAHTMYHQLSKICDVHIDFLHKFRKNVIQNSKKKNWFHIIFYCWTTKNDIQRRRILNSSKRNINYPEKSKNIILSKMNQQWCTLANYKTAGSLKIKTVQKCKYLREFSKLEPLW